MIDSSSEERPVPPSTDDQQPTPLSPATRTVNYLGKIDAPNEIRPLPDEPDTVAFDTSRCKFLGKFAPRLATYADDDDAVAAAPVLAACVVERAPNAAPPPAVDPMARDESRAVFDSLWNSLDTVMTAGREKSEAMLERLLERRKRALDDLPLKQRLGREMQSALRSGKPDPIAAAMSDFSLHPDDAGNFGIKFEMLTDEEIKEMSVALIFSTSEWDLRNNEPNFGGLLDERMGPLDRMIHLGDGHREKARCKTCAGVNNCDPHLETRPGESGECYGHFGRIELPAAVYNVMVAHLVRHILAAFCWHCGKLPGDLERNNKAIADMHKSCTDKYEKLLFLSARFGKDKHCLQCCVSRRCERCQKAPTQCDECSVFICYRPQVRTLRQMENDDKRLRTEFDEAHESIDVDENDLDDTAERDAIRRGNDYMGFPYKMFLDGNADGHTESYERFAKAVGYEDGQNMFVLHGERVRDIIVMMDPSFMQLFIDSEMESLGTIAAWFRSFVPRVVPIAPNAVRPTSVGDSEDDHSLNDTTRFYRVFLHYVHKLSVCLDPAAKNNPAVLGRAYDSLFSSRRNRWFQTNHRLDFIFIEQYGEMQYQYARGIADDIAVKFMPTHLKKRQKGAGGGAGGGKKSSTFESAAANVGGAKVSTIISFKRRLHGKEGRFRGNLVAKRVDQSGRSPITPDPRLKISQVAVPRMFMSTFSIRETIFALNVVRLAITGERLRNDWTTGIARNRCRGDAATEKLYLDPRSDFCLFNAANTNRQRISSDLQRNTRRNAIVMGQPLYRNPDMGEAGSALERPLRDGDFVLSNRQPTLHEQGMMAEEVVMFDNDGCNTVDDIRFARPLDNVPLTIRKAVQSTTQYNADFDGDEMNTHNPSGSLLSRAEFLVLMKVSDKIISTRDMSPACGLKQDSATGMWLLTSRDVFLSREEASQIMYAANEVYSGSVYTKQTYRLALRLPQPAVTRIVRDATTKKVLERIELWTGAQVASVVFPECFNYRLGALHPTSMDYKPLEPLPANADEKQCKEHETKRRKVRENVNGPMLVYGGELMYGRLDKRTCGDKHGAITQAIIRRVVTIPVVDPPLTVGARRKARFAWSHADRTRNEQEACDFLDRCGWVAIEFMTHRLFGTGLDACMLERNDPMYAKVKQTLQKAIIDIAQLTADKRMEIAIREENKHRAADDQLPWKPNYKIIHGGNYSDRVSEIERNALEIQGKAFQSSMADAAENLPFDNKFNPMLFSGGKGKPENQTGIVLAVYAQQLEGRRVIDKFVGSINLSQTNAASGVDRKRDANECETTWPAYNYRGATMITRKTIERAPSSRMLDNLLARNSPHMPAGVYPNALEAALITQSYLSGLSASAFYQHAQAAREGLCDTAVKTRDTGSEQRLAMKSCEDVSVRYDRTVRGCTNELISYRYGDTGYDPKRLEKKSLEFAGWRQESVRNHLYYRTDDECLSFATRRDLVSLRRERRQIDRCLVLSRSVLSRANESTRIITPGNIESSIVELMTFFGHPTTQALWSDERGQNVRWHYTPRDNEAFTRNRSRASLDTPVVANYVYYQAFVKHQTASFGTLGRLTEGEAARAVDSAVGVWRRDGLCDAITECEIRLRLCSKQVTRRYEMSRACLDAILKCYAFVLNEAMAPAGEAVGALMVTSVGQPATQMTLNSFHMTGKSNVGVISGLPRMQEISHVTATAHMKGLKAVIALKQEAFIFARGQRDIITRMMSLMLYDVESGVNFGAHSLHTERLLRTARRRTTEAAIVTRAKTTIRSVARQSRFCDASAKHQHVASKRLFAQTLLSAINTLTGTSATPSSVQMMLGDFTTDWRTEKFSNVHYGKCISLPLDNVEAHSLMTTKVTRVFTNARQTTPALLAESVWRALLPFVGADVRHIVFVYAEGVDAFRLAIGVLECSEKVETLLYTSLRQSRQMIFVDFIAENDARATMSLQRDCLAASPPVEVKRTGEQILEGNGSVLRNASARGLLRNMIATHLVDVTESFGILYQPLLYDAEEKRVSVQFAAPPSPVTEIDCDSMLMIYQNQIERRRVDLMEKMQLADECVGIATTPEERASAQKMRAEVEVEINVAVAPFVEKKLREQRAETQALADNDLVADASERSMCHWFYGNRLFARQIYCKKEDCAMARINPADPSHSAAACGCLSAMVAVFRLDRRWFENNRFEPAALQRSLQRELGEHFHVLIGDVNSEKYIPMHIRVRMCSLADVAKQINVNRFVDVNNFGVVSADDIDHTHEDAQLPATPTATAPETTTPTAPTESANEPHEGDAREEIEDDNEDDIDEFIVPSGVTRVSRAAIKRQRAVSKQCVKASDGALAILDHIIFVVLNHRVCGPVRGTAVMFDDDVRQTYHAEAGFENVTHTTIANNSSEFGFALNLRGVDTHNSRSNSVHDVCDIYGIEAGREAIIGEYAEVLRDGSYVNRTHLAVRADVQTRHGYLAPLTADGLRAENHDVIQSASHRENADTVVDAALHGKSTYPLTSPSACIAVGVPVRHIGTGIVTLIEKPYDEKEFTHPQPEPSKMLEMNMSEIESIMSTIEERQQFALPDYGPMRACNTDQVPVDPEKFFAEVARRREEKRREIAARKLRAEGVSDEGIKTLFDATRPGDRLEIEAMIAAHRKAHVADENVVNGIALDQLPKHVADRIHDDLRGSVGAVAAATASPAAKTMDTPITTQLPYGFHAAMLDFENESGIKLIDASDEENSGDNANGATFSPAHDDAPLPHPSPHATPHEQALESVRNDMLAMPSPHEDLNAMLANRVARASLGLRAQMLADDDIDDKQQQARLQLDDEQEPIHSPVHASDDDDVGDSSDSSAASSSDDSEEASHIVNFRNQSTDKSSALVFPLGVDEMSVDTLQTVERRKQLEAGDNDSTDAQNRVAAALAQHTTLPLNHDTKRKFAQLDRSHRYRTPIKQQTPPRIVVAPVLRQQDWQQQQRRLVQMSRSRAVPAVHRPLQHQQQRATGVEQYDPSRPYGTTSTGVPLALPAFPTVPLPLAVEEYDPVIALQESQRYDPVSNFTTRKRAVNSDLPKFTTPLPLTVTTVNVVASSTTTSLSSLAAIPAVETSTTDGKQQRTDKILDLFASMAMKPKSVPVTVRAPLATAATSVMTATATVVNAGTQPQSGVVRNSATNRYEVWEGGEMLADYNDGEDAVFDTDFMGNAARLFF